MVRSLSRKSSSALLGQGPSTSMVPPLPSGELLAQLRDIAQLEQRLDDTRLDSGRGVRDLDCAGDRIICPNGNVCHHAPRNASSCHQSPVKQTSSHLRQFSQRHASLRAAQKALESEFRMEAAEAYAKPFCDFMTANPTAYHTVESFQKQLDHAGYKEISERNAWDITPGGKYYLNRNGSSLVAFAVGKQYKTGNGAAIIAGHIDQLAFKLKGNSKMPSKGGYDRVAVAGYAGPGPTWWDRDLGVAGRVLVREGAKIKTKLVKLDWPIARLPTLAPHFGQLANMTPNKETQEVPIIGLESSNTSSTMGSKGSFSSTQPPRLVKAIAKELDIDQVDDIVSWDLELFNIEPATRGGLDREFIVACRLDDKLCSWAGVQALINSTSSDSHDDSGIIKVMACFDNEEVGSLTRQGARSNLLMSTFSRVVSSLMSSNDVSESGESEVLARVMANSFVVSSDVTHAYNPCYPSAYDEKNTPYLNVGMSVDYEANQNMTTDAVSAAIYQECANRVGHTLQNSQKRNDVRGGGTIGPMTSALTGCRSIDSGLAQLSMHSVRACCGSKDPGLGVEMYGAVFDNYEEVDKQFV